MWILRDTPKETEKEQPECGWGGATRVWCLSNQGGRARPTEPNLLRVQARRGMKSDLWIQHGAMHVVGENGFKGGVGALCTTEMDVVGKRRQAAPPGRLAVNKGTSRVVCGRR